MIEEALREHDRKPLPAAALENFKALCAYQIDHGPHDDLRETFRRMCKAKMLTYGQAATIAPFMISPPE